LRRKTLIVCGRLPSADPRREASRDLHVIVTGEPDAPKGCPSGSDRRSPEKDPHHGHLAGGLPVFKVAIRVAGRQAWTRKTEVLEYRTFYGGASAHGDRAGPAGRHPCGDGGQRGLYRAGVYALCEQDFTQIAVINPARAKALKGHKTDAKDCARLAELFECGLLRGSYIPAPELKEGAGPDPVPDQDGPGPHLGDPAAGQVAGIGWHQARLGGQRDHRGAGHGDGSRR